MGYFIQSCFIFWENKQTWIINTYIIDYFCGESWSWYRETKKNYNNNWPQMYESKLDRNKPKRLISVIPMASLGRNWTPNQNYNALCAILRFQCIFFSFFRFSGFFISFLQQHNGIFKDIDYFEILHKKHAQFRFDELVRYVYL